MRNFIISATVLLSLSLSSCAHSSIAGQFVGNVVANWSGDERSMKLIEPFAYVDERGVRWEVPAGAIIDGASIPRVFWSIVGSPYTGNYRKASVIHDYYCETMSRSWQDVHKVFFEAQLAEGNSLLHAKLLYSAVYNWGPRWEIVNGKATRTRDIIEKPSAKEEEELSSWIRATNPSLAEIVAYSNAKFPR
jgi:hypothetical protein